MSVSFDKECRAWRADYRINKERFTPLLADADGTLFSDPTARGKKRALAAEKFLKADHRRRTVAPGPASTIQRERETFTLARAFAALTPTWKEQANYLNRQAYCRELAEFFGEDTALAEIDAVSIAKYVEQCRNTPRKRWVGGPLRESTDKMNATFWKPGTKLRSLMTVNLYCDTLRAVLKLGLEHRLADGKPVLDFAPKVPFFEPPKRKARPVPIKVASELWALLPQHAREALTVTLLFGLRRSECFNLQIRHVHEDAGGIKLLAEEVKDDEDRFIAGSPAAMAYLAGLVQQARERGTFYLIAFREHRKDPVEQALVAWRPIVKPRHAWDRAMSIIEGRHGVRYRWHDLRANFITHVMRTSGADAAQDAAGHSEFETTRAYIDTDDGRARAAKTVTARPEIKAMIAGTAKVAATISPQKLQGKVTREVLSISKKSLKSL